MLILIAITPNALHSISENENMLEFFALHERCVRNYELSGFLLYDEIFHKKVGELLPQRIRKLWQIVLEKSKRSGEFCFYSNLFKSYKKKDLIEYFAANPEYFANIGKLILVGKDEANQYGIEPERFSIKDDLYEFCIANYIDCSELIKNNINRKSIQIKKGTSTEEVWSKYFDAYLKFSNRAILVDHYALENHINKNKINEYSGLENLFRFINNTNTKNDDLVVKVYSAITDKIKEDNKTIIQLITRDFEKYVEKGKISKINFYLLNDDKKKKELKFGYIVHERWIRFNDFVCNIDKGLELFEGEYVKNDQKLDITLKDYHEGKENELLRSIEKDWDIKKSIK